MSVTWSEEELKGFRENDTIGEKSIYADKIMRPMAIAFCPEVLIAFDKDWNTGNDKLGPNWHGFASDLERAIIEAHKNDQIAKLHNFYAFVNWALYEKTSYLSDESYITPLEGIASELHAEQWMKFFPIGVIDITLPHMDFYFQSQVAAGMRKERNKLVNNLNKHEAHWKPLHRKFIEVAKEKGIPYASPI